MSQPNEDAFSMVLKQLGDKIPPDVRLVKIESEDSLQTLDPMISQRCIGLCEKQSFDSIVRHFKRFHIQHFVQLSTPNTVTEILSSVAMITQPELMTSHPFKCFYPKYPIDVKSSAVAHTKFEYTFCDGSEKESVLSALEEYVKGTPLGPRFLNDILFIGDELFTNVFFHGGTNLEMTRRHLNEMKLNPGKEGYLFAGALDGRFIIGCRDLFGVLQIDKTLTHLENCFSKGISNTINLSERDGAKIGLARAVELSESIYLYVAPSVNTTLAFSINLNKPKKHNPTHFKSVHIIK